MDGVRKERKGKIMYWRGQRVDEMTRDELISALVWLAKSHEESLSPENVKIRAYGRVEMMTRGEL